MKTFEEEDILDLLVEAGKRVPQLQLVLSRAYSEVRKLRGDVSGLEWQVSELKRENADAFQQAIRESIVNADHGALMEAIEGRISERSGDW